MLKAFDGWLLYDFRGSNVLAQRVVGLDEKKFSRRWFYFVPATGEPKKLVHAIEPASLDSPARASRRPSTAAGRNWRPASASS